jgi:tRNA A-37 threonylcarbamoyl transferase component Bud32
VPGGDGIPLLGYSGCDVRLFAAEDETLFVRKTAGVRPQQSDRLRQQVKKQRLIAEKLPAGVRTPRIISEGFEQGRYFVEMEYVRGLDAVSMLRTADFKTIAAFAARLSETLSTLGEVITGAALPVSALVRSKCEEIHKSVVVAYPRAAEQVSRIAELASHFEGLSVTTSLTHGDLTLENLIFDDQGTLWLFDFLDAFLENPVVDVAKLEQDLSGGWYLRLGGEPLSRSVSLYVAETVRGSVAKSGKLAPQEFDPLLDLLVAVMFARILPYAISAAHVELVSGRVAFFANRAAVRLGYARRKGE